MYDSLKRFSSQGRESVSVGGFCVYSSTNDKRMIVSSSWYRLVNAGVAVLVILEPIVGCISVFGAAGGATGASEQGGEVAVPINLHTRRELVVPNIPRGEAVLLVMAIAPTGAVTGETELWKG